MSINLNNWFTLHFNAITRMVEFERISMRLLLILWAFPLVFFWGWFGLSYYDINFGINFFTRRTHDIVFILYGRILGMPPGEVPLALVKIFAFDSVLVFALAAWRWRSSWFPQTKMWIRTRFNAYMNRSSESEPEANEIESANVGQIQPAE